MYLRLYVMLYGSMFLLKNNISCKKQIKRKVYIILYI